MKKLILTVAAAMLLGAGSLAQACSLSAWSGTSGAVLDGGPGETNDIPRLAGLCAMSATAAGYVEDLSPVDEGRMIASFYYLANGAGNATLMQAFSDEAGASPIFTVSTNGGMVTVTSDDGGSNASAPASAGWNPVQVDWNQGGAIDLWVGSDATTDPADASGTSGSGVSTISSVRLGPAAGLGGFTSVLFDQYESRRSQAIANVVPGDANGNGSCSVGDAVSILNEFLTGNPANNTGTPDRNLNGAISVGDAVLTLNAFLTAQC